MGDIDFEEQLKLEKLEKDRLASGAPKERVDPDGTVYEWDYSKNAWFPKIDDSFIAKYQMNYGVSDTAGDETTASQDQSQAEYEKSLQFYQNYNQAASQEAEVLNKKKKKVVVTEDTHDEAVGKLEELETKIQTGEVDDTSQEYQADSREEMEKYSDEQKKEYNEYWSYYYETELHDYYADCMAQAAETEVTAGQEGDKTQEGKEDKKKGKKRKAPPPKEPEAWFEMSDKDNTNVYVSGLPTDITPPEFIEMMVKYGLIMNDPRTKKPKAKLYVDENGQPKGDARCCFIKKESVDLVMNLLDGSELRGHTIKVEIAKFTLKGDFDPTKKKKKLTNKEKRRLKERQAKLFDWRPDKPRNARAKNERTVIIKNVFDPKTFEEKPEHITTVSQEVRTECTKYGEVKKVVVYDRHEDGIVSVMYSTAEEADMCIEYMHQRYLGQRRLLIETWDGKTKYEIQESEAEREARLKKWENFLVTGEEDGKTTSTSTGSASADTDTDTEVKVPETDTVEKLVTSEVDGKTTSTSSASVDTDTEVKISETEAVESVLTDDKDQVNNDVGEKMDESEVSMKPDEDAGLNEVTESENA